jgi:hypothetical protein
MCVPHAFRRLSWDTLYLPNPKNIFAMIHMLTPKIPKDIQVFNGMAQYYQCFIKDFTFIMAPITKLLQKTKAFKWTTQCQHAWEKIKECYMDAPILISPHWESSVMFTQMLLIWQSRLCWYKTLPKNTTN